MSGIDRITDKILGQARLQAENRVNYSKEAARKNEANLQKRFDRTLEAEKKHAEDKGDEAAKRVIANVMLEGRKKKLAARQEAVNRVFEKAMEKLVAMPEDAYTAFLADLAAGVLGKGKNELILNTSDAGRVGPGLVKALEGRVSGADVVLSEENVSAMGGLIVRNGDIQTNLTIESIMRLEREKLEADVVGIIFESE